MENPNEVRIILVKKLCGSLTVEFDGEERTMPQMRKYLEVTDRDVLADIDTPADYERLVHKASGRPIL